MAKGSATGLWPLALGAGILLHIVAFRFGEWDRAYHKPASLYAIGALAGSAYVHFISTNGEVGLVEAFRAITFLELVSIAGIFSSMVVYRSFFHRLNRFPGPFMARPSNWYITSLSVRNLRLYEEVEKLHRKYGDFVRVGPTEISINNADAIQKIHGATTKCSKGPWYDLNAWNALQTTRDKADHARRRKVWDRGLNSRSMREYEPRVNKYTDQLMTQIEKHAGKPTNMTDWFNFYSFDVMGDMAFGAHFGMLHEGVKHYFMTALHGFMEGVGVFSHAVWLIPIFRWTPILNAEEMKFGKWIGEQVDKRRKNRPEQPDVFSWILEDFESKKERTAQEHLDLQGDAYLIAVAGSDTTAASLTTLFYELAQKPKVVKKLQQEIDEAFDKGEIDYSGLSKRTYLQACVDEAMRLHPAVPGGTQRLTPPQGLEIDGTYIPGNTIVQIPIHTIQRDPRYYERPNEFIPERWTDQPELVMNADTFIPFSTGPYGCVGKQLGLMEIRTVTAQILHDYNVKFAPGYKKEQFLKDKKDCFTLALGPLDLVFDPRK